MSHIIQTIKNRIRDIRERREAIRAERERKLKASRDRIRMLQHEINIRRAEIERIRIGRIEGSIRVEKMGISNAMSQLDRERKLLEQESQQLDSNGYDDMRELLRQRRGINPITSILHQYTMVGESRDIDEVTHNDLVNYLTENIGDEIRNIGNILHQQRLTVNISIAFSFDGLEINYRTDTFIRRVDQFYNVMESLHMRFTSIDPDYTRIIGFSVLMAAIPNRQNFYQQLRAYAPIPDRNFHKETECSTTTNRLCIYETFLHIIGKLNIKGMKKGNNEAKRKLLNEDANIQQYVKDGKVTKALELLTIKYNTPVYIKFYNSTFKPIKIFGSEINEVDHKDIVGKKIMLYGHRHVAPAIVKEENLIQEEVKRKYQLVPPIKNKKGKKKKKKEDITILAYDYETFTKNYNANPYCVSLYGEDEKTSFYGVGCTKLFADYLDKNYVIEGQLRKGHEKEAIKQYYIYGFNNSNFDNTLLYNELLDRLPCAAEDMVVVGKSIKYMKYYNIHFYDIALFYNNGGLEGTAYDFKKKNDEADGIDDGIAQELEKGVFPYKFVNENNLHYIGGVPDEEYWKKGEEDRNKYIRLHGNIFDMEKYTKEYCELDAQITYLIAKIHMKNCKGIIELTHKKVIDFDGQIEERETKEVKQYDVTKCITAASLSLSLFRQVFLKTWLEESPPEIYTKEKRAYKGGRTEVFKKNFKGHKLYEIDINSSYPASMCEAMPFKYIETRYFEECNNRKITKTNLYCARVVYKGNDPNYIPNILSRTEKGRIIGTKETYYDYHWGVELIEAIREGCEVLIKEEHVYESQIIFKEFATYFYTERLKVKPRKDENGKWIGNASLAMFYKLLLNSLYGKFGQNEYTKKLICYNADEINAILSDTKNELVSFMELSSNKVLLEFHNEDAENNNIGKLVRFASYITAVSRTRLSEAMFEIGFDHIYYTDTDSIFTDKLPPNSFISKTELGKFKVEFSCEEAMFFAPKTYVCKGIENHTDKKGQPVTELIKAKGIPSRLLNIEEMTMESLEKGIKKNMDAMFFRSLDGIEIRDDCKRTLGTVYDKRKWEDNSSYPYKDLKEWESNTMTAEQCERVWKKRKIMTEEKEIEEKTLMTNLEQEIRFTETNVFVKKW